MKSDTKTEGYARLQGVDQHWEASLMLGHWPALAPVEQDLARAVARREGIECARRLFVAGHPRREDDMPVSYPDFEQRFVKRAPLELRGRWERRPFTERLSDPRVYHFVAALETERRRLMEECPLPHDLDLLQRSAQTARQLADTVVPVVLAGAELSEMLVAAAADPILDPGVLLA
jgi:hypothetical protein